MDSLRTCELTGANAPSTGHHHPGVTAPDRIDRQALFAVLVRAGQPLCVEHAIRTRWAAAEARENLPWVRGPGRRVTQVARAVILALAHGLGQVLQ